MGTEDVVQSIGALAHVFREGMQAQNALMANLLNAIGNMASTHPHTHSHDAAPRTPPIGVAQAVPTAQSALPQQDQPATPSLTTRANAVPIPERRSQTAAELSADLPKGLVKEIKKQYEKFHNKLEQCYKYEHMIQSLKGEIQGMASNVKHYPAGTRPFRSNESRAELDQGWSACAGAPKELTITIPAGTSRRDAMQQIHQKCSLALKGIDLEAHEAEQNNLLTITSTSHWVQQVDQLVESYIQSGKDNLISRQDLDINKLGNYTLRLHQEGQERHLRDERKRMEKQKEEREKEEQLKAEIAQTAPAALLAKFVDNKVNALRSELELGPGMAVDSEDPVLTSFASAIGKGKGNSRKPKNAQPGGQGKNPEAQQKGKDGGKGPTQKGKGKSRKNKKGKDKGASKGKSGSKDGGKSKGKKGGKGRGKGGWTS